ncbi:HET-domain-containing protein [Hypoxylon trugodes]|uniref:HET-domain-containing protein n=1 Tax=Hypoxylon trugodes TaxID=326681 RepID=UPI002194A870|nr:HET-domain-containing protein [Hypoxylon trugodes]KAI1389512.1 HET-domain-containing protein [Hypoxylon trugodes]
MQCQICGSKSSNLSKIWPHPSDITLLNLNDWKIDLENILDGSSTHTPGCVVCETIFSLLIDTKENHSDLQTFRHFTCRTAFLRAHFDPFSQNYVLILNALTASLTDFFPIMINPPSNTLRNDKYESRNKIPVSSDSPEAFGLAKRLLDTCRREHLKCASCQMDYVPSRVLHLDHEGVRLVLRSEVKEGCDYVALSYCWGNSQSLITTKYTLESHRTGIPLEALPKVFKDAVNVTRRLSMCYLWIDALCIIQGDQEDWESESGQMENVYGNAELVLAAAISPNPHDGFLRDRAYLPTWRYASIKMNTRIPRIKFTYRLLARHKGEPLDSRAWAFQERFLARRYLAYRDGCMMWECREGIYCECGFFAEQLHATATNLDYMLSSRPQMGPAGLWRADVVGVYSKMALTFPSDKFVALSAVASRFQSITGDTYLAGLWKEDLANQLCWRTSKRSYPESFYAPSWSWASVDGKFGIGTHRAESVLSNILDASVVPSTINRFGPVSDGFVRVRGKPILAELHIGNSYVNATQINPEPDHANGNIRQNCSIVIPDVECQDMDCSIDVPLIADGFIFDPAAGKPVDSVRRIFHTERDVYSIRPGAYSVWLFPLIRYRFEFYALILGPSLRRPDLSDHFERVGLLMMRNPPNWYEEAQYETREFTLV